MSEDKTMMAAKLLMQIQENELTQLRAENAELRKDSDRLNFLDSLCLRKDPDIKDGVNGLKSDMHFGPLVYLYIRNICGHVVNSGSGECGYAPCDQSC